jgi:ankyrin repeat protein
VVPSPLIDAVKEGQISNALLAQGVDVNQRNENKDTPLMWAASTGQADIIDILMQSAPM